MICMNNKIKRFLLSGLVASLLLMVLSCGNMVQKELSDKSSEVDNADSKTYLSINLGVKNNARTILPENPETVNGNFHNFVLKGSSQYVEEKELAAWEEATDIPQRIEVLPGDWTFTLSAVYDGAYGEIPYSATVSATIKRGIDNSVSFVLKPQGEFGGFVLRLDLSSNTGVDKVIASLKKLSGQEIDSRTWDSEALTNVGREITYYYSGNDENPSAVDPNDPGTQNVIRVGTYLVTFEFFTDKDPTPINSWENYIYISPMTLTQKLDVSLNFNEVRTLTLKDEDGSDITTDDISSGIIIKKFSTRSNFDLPVCSKDDKIFLGWKDSNSENIYTKITPNITNNLTLTAYFVDPILYVSDNYNEDDSFTGELGSDDNFGFTASSPLKTIDGACELIYKYGRPDLDWTIKVNGSITGITNSWPWKEQSNIPEKLEKSKHGKTILLTGMNALVSDLPQDMINRGMNRSATTDQSNTGTVLVVATDIPVTITNLKLTHGNRASSNTTSSGGALRVESNATVSLGNGVWLHDNYAKCGGGVFNLGTLYVYGSAVIGDKSKTTIASGYASVDGSSCFGSSGGGIYNMGKAYLGYDNYVSETVNNPVTWSGGIYYNFASAGGAIYNAASAILIMKSGNLAYNASGTSGSGGGAVYNLGAFTMTGGVIENNDAKGTKGGGVNNAYSNTEVFGTWTFAGGTIKSNKSSDAYGYSSGGGGVVNTGIMYVYGDAVIGDSSASAFATDENNCSNYAAGDGGGVLVEGTGKAYFGYKSYTSSTVNETATWSGGIYYNYAGTDTSSNGGGGIAIKDGKVYMHSGTINKNGAALKGNAIFVGGPLYLQGSPSIVPGTDEKNNIYINNYTDTKVVWIDGPLSTSFTALLTPYYYESGSSRYQALKLVDGANTTIAAECSKFSIASRVDDNLGVTEEWQIDGETGKLKPTLEQITPNSNQISIDIGYNTVDLDMRPDGTAYSRTDTVYTLEDTTKPFKIYLYNSGNYQDFEWLLDGEQISTADNIIFGGSSGLNLSSWSKGIYDLTFECTRKADNLKYSYAIQIKIE